MNKEIIDIETSLKDICCIKDGLASSLKGEVTAGVKRPEFNIMEVGEVTDAIKDLSEAEEKCWKALYYKKIVEAMDDPEKAMQVMNFMRGSEGMGMDNWHENFFSDRSGYSGGSSGNSGGRGGSSGGSGGSSGSYGGSSGGSSGSSSRSGYDDWRYADGRFAPKGEGHRSGFYDPNMKYTDDDMRMMENELHNGGAYRDYRVSKRYYTDTGSAEDRKKMDEHAMKHVMEFIETAREIYREASPELKKRMKEDLTKLVSEMTY